MAMPAISVPAFPDVPMVPGVPALLREVGAVLPLPVVELADAFGLSDLLQVPQWGIYSASGAPAIVGDSVLAVRYQNDSRVSDYPVEAGQFASYNKVQTPFGVKLTFVVGGSFSGGNIVSAITSGSISGAISSLSGDSARSAFLAACQAALISTDFFTVMTPEVSYANMNIVHYDYQRTSRRGVTMLEVDVWCEEIRQAPAAQFTKTQSPNGATDSNGGTVQTIPVTSEQLPPITAAGAH